MNFAFVMGPGEKRNNVLRRHREMLEMVSHRSFIDRILVLIGHIRTSPSPDVQQQKNTDAFGYVTYRP